MDRQYKSGRSRNTWLLRSKSTVVLLVGTAGFWVAVMWWLCPLRVEWGWNCERGGPGMRLFGDCRGDGGLERWKRVFIGWRNGCESLVVRGSCSIH